MDRRQALKNLSLSLGYALTAPTIASILSACSDEKPIKNLIFLTKKQKFCVSNLADIIIPKTETPGALDVNIVDFIDIMIADTKTKNEQSIFIKGSLEFEKDFEKKFQTKILKGTKNQYHQALTDYFTISNESKDEMFKLIQKDIKEVPKTKHQQYFIYNYLITVRKLCLFGYYTSQIVVENSTENNSNLGYYKGCVTL